MKQKWLIIGGIVAVAVIAAIIFVFSYTYKVNGTVTDISTKTSVANAGVSIAGHKATTGVDGKYSIVGIKFYEKKPIQVTTPSAYIKPSQITLSYSSRSITKNFTLEPTLQTSVGVVDTAEQNLQYDYLWSFMQPDSQAYWGDQTTYTNTMKTVYSYEQSQNISTTDTKISGTIVILPSWKDPITGKTFKNVYEVPVSFNQIDNGQSTPKTQLTYFQEINGFYHYFTQTDKTTAQTAANAINALQ